jgi:hypothetical protein
MKATRASNCSGSPNVKRRSRTGEDFNCERINLSVRIFFLRLRSRAFVCRKMRDRQMPAIVAHALALARRAGVQTFGAFELAAALAAAPLGVS